MRDFIKTVVGLTSAAIRRTLQSPQQGGASRWLQPQSHQVVPIAPVSHFITHASMMTPPVRATGPLIVHPAALSHPASPTPVAVAVPLPSAVPSSPITPTPASGGSSGGGGGSSGGGGGGGDSSGAQVPDGSGVPLPGAGDASSQSPYANMDPYSAMQYGYSDGYNDARIGAAYSTNAYGQDAYSTGYLQGYAQAQNDAQQAQMQQFAGVDQTSYNYDPNQYAFDPSAAASQWGGDVSVWQDSSGYNYDPYQSADPYAGYTDALGVSYGSVEGLARNRLPSLRRGHRR